LASKMVAASGMAMVPVTKVPVPSGMAMGAKVEQ